MILEKSQNTSPLAVVPVNASWQRLLANAITNVEELLTLLDLKDHFSPAALQAAQLFPLRVSRSFVARMEKGNICDPLLRQILPISEELTFQSGYSQDPVGDKAATKLPGLLHKYYGRVLLTVTGSCAVNCRYCFRRAFPYSDNNPGSQGWKAVLEYIAADSSIKEVIFSGGDPLIALDKTLAQLATQVAAIPHVSTLRIHTRVPIMLPERINQELINWFAYSRLKPILVLHTNHANEIDGNVAEALFKLRNAGITLLNQSVLLRGVNDNAEALIALSQRLFSVGVLPYYLHYLDKVQGAAHFAITETQAKLLIKQVAHQLPGYLVPKLVKEEVGKLAKSPVF